MTEMADEGFAMAKNPENSKADALLRHPSGRFGQPSDIARAVVWLACQLPGYGNQGQPT